MSKFSHEADEEDADEDTRVMTIPTAMLKIEPSTVTMGYIARHLACHMSCHCMYFRPKYIYAMFRCLYMLYARDLNYLCHGLYEFGVFT